MTFRFEFDGRDLEKQLRRAVEDGVEELADQHAAETHREVVGTWNRLRRECRGMSQKDAEILVEQGFRSIGIEFADSAERAEWTTGILADEDLDLHVNLDIKWT